MKGTKATIGYSPPQFTATQAGSQQLACADHTMLALRQLGYVTVGVSQPYHLEGVIDL